MRLGIDVGGSRIKAGLVSQGKVIRRVILPAGRGKAAFLVSIVNAARMALGERHVERIGVGCPGPLDWRSGRILSTGNIPLSNFNLKLYLQRVLKAPVVVDNDARCFTLGEALYGEGKGCKMVCGLTLGTGVGGGIVIDGKLVRGRGNAGEFGHTIIKFDGHKCNCGSIGCAEEYLSARGIMRLAKGAKSPQQLYQLAKSDSGAKKVFSTAGTHLGILTGNIIRELDPDIIVIGGAISKAGCYLAPSMEQQLKKLNYSRGKVVFSDSEDSAIIGAAENF